MMPQLPTINVTTATSLRGVSTLFVTLLDRHGAVPVNLLIEQFASVQSNIKNHVQQEITYDVGLGRCQ